jgi:hypothetical protein
MGSWALVFAIAEFFGTLILILILQWASVERARVHRQWAQQRRTCRAPVDWYVTLSLAVGCV